MRMAAYNLLIEFGPDTAGGLYQSMIEHRGKELMKKNDLSSRLTELRDLGLAREQAELKDCRVTNRKCLVFEVVDALPKARPQRVTATQKCVALRQENERLHGVIAALEKRILDLSGDDDPQLTLGV
jgi:hypothetical protein